VLTQQPIPTLFRLRPLEAYNSNTKRTLMDTELTVDGKLTCTPIVRRFRGSQFFRRSAPTLGGIDQILMAPPATLKKLAS
jgi:hypothetical protein